MNTINLAELRKPSTAENSTLPKLSGKKRLLSDMNIKDAFAKSLEIKYIGPDSTIVSQNSAITGLYYVIDGSLEIYNRSADVSAPNRYIYTVESGGIAGYLTSVVGFRSMVTIKTPRKPVQLSHTYQRMTTTSCWTNITFAITRCT